MLLEKFLNLIDKTWMGRAIDRKRELISKTDPDRIYVENIRQFFRMPYRVAKGLCEMAVKERVFNKKEALICPSCGRVIKSCEVNEELKGKIICTVCQANEEDSFCFNVNDLGRRIYYQLKA